MNKKYLAVILSLAIIAFYLPAIAENSSVNYSGTVEYTNTITVTAPFGGNIEDYTLRVGDTVTAGEPLLALAGNNVYAPQDGIVRGLLVLPGDDAAQTISRYGALLYLQPNDQYTLTASTSGAYDSDELHNTNRYLTPGEIVYMQSTADDTRTGTGLITNVDGRSFTVEVQSGTLDPEDTVNLFREASFTTSSRIARNARLQNTPMVAITAEGSVLRCAVTEGQSVKRGDLLLETVTGTLEGLQPGNDQIISPVDGVIVSLMKKPGDAVTKNDVLATLYSQDALRVTFPVDESDLDRIAVGNQASVMFDALPERSALTGTVEAISSLPVSDNGSPQYTVTITLSSTEGLRDGMSVTVSLP